MRRGSAISAIFMCIFRPVTMSRQIGIILCCTFMQDNGLLVHLGQAMKHGIWIRQRTD
ncbi:unknown protein [Paenibacillus amylolyticus]|uniref:Uncharacterized protein n=1 Tax=Paenibacillus amylolyticus TaxID=1451 RepID=A0A117I3C3_PAEAM|nr:unknown protein [Paenibacillus amylolyticus]